MLSSETIRFTLLSVSGAFPAMRSASLKRYLEDRVGGFLANEISSQGASAVRLLWLFMRGRQLCVHQEVLGDAEALGEASELEGLLGQNAQSLRGSIPQVRETATALLASEGFARLQTTLSEQVERYATGAPQRPGRDDNLVELDELRNELNELLRNLEVQSSYDPVIAPLRDRADAIEYEAELLEAGEFGAERLVTHRTEVYVRTLNIRQMQPALPLQNRADLLGAIGDVMFLRQALARAADPDEHCVIVELTRVTRSGGASRFARSEPGLLEWLAVAYLEGRGRCDAQLVVGDKGEPVVGGKGGPDDATGTHRLMTGAWSRAVLRFVGPGVRSFFAAEHGTHIRDSRTSGTEMVRVRICAGREHPSAHLARVDADRARFVAALEQDPPSDRLPPHPDAILPTVRRYRHDPTRPGELSEIVVEDYPLMYSISTFVRRLADVMPTLWLLRRGVAAVPGIPDAPSSDPSPEAT